jgi:hypothetical protein
MRRYLDHETAIIALALGVVYLAFLRIGEWMPELGLLGNMVTGDVALFGNFEVKYHSIVMACSLAICWAICLKVRRAKIQRAERHSLPRHSLR